MAIRSRDMGKGANLWVGWARVVRDQANGTEVTGCHRLVVTKELVPDKRQPLEMRRAA